jgi:cellulose synthase/poly-beta-1,6-N-acetylglucosamine synthase-like glycosyltransferase
VFYFWSAQRIFGVRREKKRENIDYAPVVGVLIPAYNEEKMIAETVNSFKRQAYPLAEIISNR